MNPWTKSFALAAAIIGLGAVPALVQETRLETLRHDHRDLVARASAAGLAQEPDGRITKRPRGAAVAGQARAVLAAILDFAGSAPAAGDSSARQNELILQLTALDAAGLQELIAGLRTAPGLDSGARAGFLFAAIKLLAEDQPAAALAAVESDAERLGADEAAQLRAACLALWAETDPAAAAAWLRGRPALGADEDARLALIGGAAAADPAAALDLIDRLEIADPANAAGPLAEAARTPVQRTAVLEALRQRVASQPDAATLLDETLEAMARNLSGEEFATTSAWLADAKLAPEEAAAFAAGLSWFNTKEDTGQWLDWMATRLPAADAADVAGDLIGQWTQEDYLAAGKWLAAAPAGPLKTAAVASYAATVADTEPQTAVLWAETLPPGKLRETTLRQIHDNWPESDAAARDEFARNHGLGEAP